MFCFYGWLGSWLTTPAAAQLYILRAAAPDASAAPFIFTAATEGTGNSRFALGILEFLVMRS
ncbi:MAG: hypothetical protein SPE37_06785 [Campylobacter sp.]|nr:hypothetical protein [Campylobacter sp.]